MTKTMTTMSGGCPVRATNAPSWSCAAPAWSGKTKTGCDAGRGEPVEAAIRSKAGKAPDHVAGARGRYSSPTGYA